MKSGDAVLYEMIEVTLRLLNNEKIDSNLATLVSQALLILVSKLRISFLLFSIEINEETEGFHFFKNLIVFFLVLHSLKFLKRSGSRKVSSYRTITFYFSRNR
jgi:hypothetical protein